MGMAGMHAPPSKSRPSRWGALDGQSGDRYFGVYVPTRFGGELKVKTTSGRVIDLKGPNGVAQTNGQDVGIDQQGWYTFKVEGAKKPYKVETTFVQVGREYQEALELLLLADEGRLDPRALGRGQRPGRHDERRYGRRPVDRHARGLHRARAGHRPGRAKRVLETLPAAGRRRNLVPQPL